jgi:hypothetical protein
MIRPAVNDLSGLGAHGGIAAPLAMALQGLDRRQRSGHTTPLTMRFIHANSQTQIAISGPEKTSHNYLSF